MIPFLLQAVKSLGHQVFTNGDYNLNIIGVRNPIPRTNEFDDMICVVYKEDGKWITRCWPATTDPGTYWLKNPMKTTGTAIMVPGQYRGAYKIGMHRGQYQALVQRGGKVRIWRDNNRDEILNYEEDEVDGFFGINIHRATAHGASPEVNKWSAGCQVFQDSDDFAEFMALVNKSSEKYGPVFSYTLIVPKNFIMEA